MCLFHDDEPSELEFELGCLASGVIDRVKIGRAQCERAFALGLQLLGCSPTEDDSGQRVAERIVGDS